MSSDKKGKKVEKKFNVDFSNIVGGSPAPIPKEAKEPPRVEQKKQDKPATQATGIMLSIPVVEVNKILSIDIAHCTGTEFCEWLGTVYPCKTTERDIQVFEHFEPRLKMFKKVVNFHQHFHISGSRKPKDPPVA